MSSVAVLRVLYVKNPWFPHSPETVANCAAPAQSAIQPFYES